MLPLIKHLYYKLCMLLDNIKKDVHYQVTRPEYNKLTFTYRTIPKIGRIARAVVLALGIYARGIRMAVVHSSLYSSMSTGKHLRLRDMVKICNE